MRLSIRKFIFFPPISIESENRNNSEILEIIFRRREFQLFLNWPKLSRESFFLSINQARNCQIIGVYAIEIQDVLLHMAFTKVDWQRASELDFEIIYAIGLWMNSIGYFVSSNISTVEIGQALQPLNRVWAHIQILHYLPQKKTKKKKQIVLLDGLIVVCTTTTCTQLDGPSEWREIVHRISLGQMYRGNKRNKKRIWIDVLTISN